MLKERLLNNLPERACLTEHKKNRQFCQNFGEKIVLEKENAITIKFVGDFKENIEAIVSSLQCSDYCKSEVSHILLLYSKKISSLREERNFYKTLAETKDKQNTKKSTQLKRRLHELEEELNFKNKIEASNYQKCTCLDQEHECCFGGHYSYSDLNKDHLTEAYGSSIISQMPQSQFSLNFSHRNETKNHQYLTVSPLECEVRPVQGSEESILIENEENILITQEKQEVSHLDSNISLQSQLLETGDNLTQSQLMNLMLKYNFSFQQLQQILEEYENEHKLANELFDSQKQRNLFKLGQKMQRTFKNKKVLQDVKKLSSIKSEILNKS